MIKHIRFWTLGAALAGTSLMSLNPSAPMVPGPGGVIDAVRAYAKAIDAGDIVYIRSAMVDHKAHQGSPGFHDVAFDGKPVDANTVAGFADALQAAAKRRGDNRVEHHIKRIVADCPSGRCSYAYVEFDRVISGKMSQRVPMRATVLLTHIKVKPYFKIFHWNVSRTDGKAWAPVSASKPQKTAKRGG